MSLSAWIWPAVLAPFVGSFLGVVVMRFDAPKGILFGRSSCPACATRLAPIDLVPVVSWLALHGRCRQCAASLGAFYPAIELSALAVALWSATAVFGPTLWASCLLGWILLALALIDHEHFVLPDFLTFPLIPAGLIAAWALDPSSLADHAAGAICGAAFVMILRWIYGMVRGREGIGIGDAKLLAAGGAWVSWDGLPSVLLLAALSGLAIALLARWRGRTVAMTDRVPFGTFLCIGIWLVWLYGPLQIGGN